MEVVDGRKNGAREGHIPEKKVPLPSRVSLARSALSSDYFQAPTTQAKDKAIIGKKIASLKFRYKGKKSFICIIKYWGRTCREGPIRKVNLFAGPKKSLLLGRCQSFPKTS